MKFDECISVILPTFNNGKYLRTAIQSILNQTYRNFELLIINDGSTDDTENIIMSFRDERIKYFMIEHTGKGKALNFGLKNAQHNWVAVMDSDDIALPERFAYELNYKKLNYNDVLFPDSVYFMGNKIKFLNTTSGNNVSVNEKIRLHGHICMSGVIFNKNFILENGGFDESLGNSEDYDLWLKIIERANFVHVNSPLMFVRLRNNSLSRVNYKKTKDTIYSIKQKNNISYTGIQAGWNEFFFGTRAKARVIFRRYLLNPYVMSAFLVSLLPERLFDYTINNKLILKLKYDVYKVLFYQKHRKMEKELREYNEPSLKSGSL